MAGRLAYAEAVAELENALKFGINPSLDGIRALAHALGRPQDAFAVVQVAGTNGKSSVTRLIAALLTAEGLSTGAYTSPHLESYTERIELGGTPCSEGDFAEALSAALGAAEEVGVSAGSFTEFELLTAAALWLFRERGVDLACLEVGMGGRWDATSVTDPAVAVVTGVGLDHTERLGSTVDAIAFDKSHVIKPGASVVLGPGTAPVADVFLGRAESFGLHPRFVAADGAATPVPENRTVRFEVTARPDHPGGTLALDVRGMHAEYRGLALVAPSYQAPNVATAVAAAECALGRALDPDAARAAL
ncbi:MAG TPA: Mur ligase family protein, partial [Coriobacteriia bacterium]